MGGGGVAEGGARLAFRHGLIRQVLYEGVPAAVREAVHVQAAGGLAAAGGAGARFGGGGGRRAGWAVGWRPRAAADGVGPLRPALAAGGAGPAARGRGAR